MKKFYVTLCSILLSTLSFIACAQSTSEDKKYNNDVGFNTTFLFTGILNSGQTPFTLMYKKYNSNQNPLRFGIRSSINLTDYTPNSGSNYNNINDINIGFVIGKEFQKAINQNWIWYYGGDIVPAFEYFKSENYYNNNLNQSYLYKSIGIGFMPFLGIRFNINERLYLSTEFSFGPTYAYISVLDKIENPEIVNRDTKGGYFNFSMNPAYGLFLYYRF
jgi:hypothetical protein